MRSPKSHCRNCRCDKITTTDNGFVAPFFAKRVWGLENPSLGEFIAQKIDCTSSRRDKLKLRLAQALLKSLPAPLQFIDSRPAIKTKINFCAACGFVGPTYNYTPDMLNALYYDYRSETYNAERCRFEPEYGAYMQLVGRGEAEVNVRIQNINQIIQKYIDPEKINAALDYGGGDGRFLPTAFEEKEVTILEVTRDPPANKNYLIQSALREGQLFDYIQLAHVLEHVSEPLLLAESLCTHLSEGGFLYVELPKERTDQELSEILINPLNFSYTLHEHINIYSKKSISALGEKLGLKNILVTERNLDLGWTKLDIISALFQK